MRFLTLIIFIVLHGRAAPAQPPPQRDSLLRVYRQASSDTVRVSALIDIGKLFFNGQPDSGLVYIRRALDLARKISYDRGIVRGQINMAYLVYDKGRFDEAIALCTEALPVCERLGMGKELAAACNTIANAWKTKGNKWLAIEYYERSLRAMKTAEVPPIFPIVVQNNLSIIFNDLRLYDKGLAYSRKCLELAGAIGDEQTQGTACQNIANAFLGLRREKEAMDYLQRAVGFARRTDYKRLLSTSLSNIADLYQKRGELNAARRNYEESIRVARETGDLYNIMLNLHGLSLLALEQQQWSRARGYARQSLDLARQMGANDYSFAIYLTLSDIALGEGNLAAWKNNRRQYEVIRDTVANNALVHAVEEMEIKFETQKKEQQIRQLRQQQELQALRLERNKELIFGLSALASLSLVTGFFGYYAQRSRKRLAQQEVLIQDQKIKELEREKQLSAVDAMLRGQEEERGRLARDLHDGLGGMLSGIKQSLFVMKGNQIVTETTAHALSQVINDLDRSINELRHIARNMMPEALVRFGLCDALQDYCDHIRQSARLDVHFQAFGFDARIPQQMEVIFFRIAQELLNNVLKHAGATQVLVQLIRDEDRVHLTIEDNGRGFDAERLRSAPGVGWVNIRSRVNYLNGTLDLRSAPGKGTSVYIECLIHDPNLHH